MLFSSFLCCYYCHYFGSKATRYDKSVVIRSLASKNGPRVGSKSWKKLRQYLLVLPVITDTPQMIVIEKSGFVKENRV